MIGNKYARRSDGGWWLAWHTENFKASSQVRFLNRYLSWHNIWKIILRNYLFVHWFVQRFCEFLAKWICDWNGMQKPTDLNYEYRVQNLSSTDLIWNSFLSANYCYEQSFPLSNTKTFFSDLRLCLNYCDWKYLCDRTVWFLLHFLNSSCLWTIILMLSQALCLFLL